MHAHTKKERTKRKIREKEWDRQRDKQRQRNWQRNRERSYAKCCMNAFGFCWLVHDLPTLASLPQLSVTTSKTDRWVFLLVLILTRMGRVSGGGAVNNLGVLCPVNQYSYFWARVGLAMAYLWQLWERAGQKSHLAKWVMSDVRAAVAIWTRITLLRPPQTNLFSSWQMQQTFNTWNTHTIPKVSDNHAPPSLNS